MTSSGQSDTGNVASAKARVVSECIDRILELDPDSPQHTIHSEAIDKLEELLGHYDRVAGLILRGGSE